MNYGNIFTSVGTLAKPAVNNPGICFIQFARWEDVAIWPDVDPNTGICNTPIQLQPGTQWYLMVAPDNDRSFTEQQQNDSKGDYYKVQVTGYIPGNDEATIQRVAPMPYHDYVLLVKDRDGLIRLIGSPDCGAAFINSYTSGNQGNIRKRTITFNWESVNPCLIYPPPPPSTVVEGEFSTDFNDTEYNV